LHAPHHTHELASAPAWLRAHKAQARLGSRPGPLVEIGQRHGRRGRVISETDGRPAAAEVDAETAAVTSAEALVRIVDEERAVGLAAVSAADDAAALDVAAAASPAALAAAEVAAGEADDAALAAAALRLVVACGGGVSSEERDVAPAGSCEGGGADRGEEAVDSAAGDGAAEGENGVAVAPRARRDGAARARRAADVHACCDARAPRRPRRRAVIIYLVVIWWMTNINPFMKDAGFGLTSRGC
jgi:hypothetical protein